MGGGKWSSDAYSTIKSTYKGKTDRDVFTHKNIVSGAIVRKSSLVNEGVITL